MAQRLSPSKNIALYGNLGFMLGERSNGRLHVNYAELQQQITSPLTHAQLHGNASLDDPSPSWPDHRIKTNPHLRLAYQHSINYADDDRITLGAYHMDTSFDLLGTIVPIEYAHGTMVYRFAAKSSAPWVGGQSLYLGFQPRAGQQ